MLQKLEQLNRTLSRGAEWVGFGALFLMVVLTCVDVLGAKLFRLPVFGSIDVMMLAQLVAISCAGAMALLHERHVSVEFFVMLLHRRVRFALEGVAELLSLGLFVLLAWRLAMHGYHLQQGGEGTATAHIPIAPFAYLAALAMVPMCLVLLHRFLSSVTKAVSHEP